MNYVTERENNIVKNIAKEIVVECSQSGFEVTQELADCMVKLKLLNPRYGFTASEVMPRNLTQQLVMLVVEELKQDTPAMNCIRMQVYWESVKMNVADLKKEYLGLTMEKAESYLTEIMAAEREENSKMIKNLAGYILCGHNMGNYSQTIDLKETLAALHSVFKQNDVAAFYNLTPEQKLEKIKSLSDTVTGVRLYLKYIGKAGEGVRDVSDLPNRIEFLKKEVSAYSMKLSLKIEDIREVILNVTPMDYFTMDVTPPNPNDNLPPDCDENDLKYLKKILAVMIQHRIYLSDILSKLDEIDGDSNFFLKEFDATMQRLQVTIRDRDAVPRTEVFDEFAKASEIWMEIQSYFSCIEMVQKIVENLESINKKEYFVPTSLEKAYTLKTKVMDEGRKKSMASASTSAKSRDLSSALVLQNSEDFQVEFNGYCAWTLYYVEGLLVPSNPDAGAYQYQDQYYAFSSKFAQELWSKDPQYFLIEIYKYLRENPELIFLLNAYENLYNIKTLSLAKKVDRKISVRQELIQTDVHPIPEFWDKDYTFSIWELKKRALALSRMVKCVTKSVQTVSPHSHFRASIGILAAPDKDKEVQTKKDSSCNHEVVANYLYGLRGHRENKFCVVELTRPVDESFQKKIILEEEDLCRLRMKPKPPQIWSDPCPSMSSDDSCNFYSGSSDYLNKFGEY